MIIFLIAFISLERKRKILFIKFEIAYLISLITRKIVFGFKFTHMDNALSTTTSFVVFSLIVTRAKRKEENRKYSTRN